MGAGAQVEGNRGRAIACVIGVALVAAASVALRWPGLTQGGFASHDVAGILHEAMVIADGGLPYVDTIELKAPGTFWLARWLAGPAGVDIARFQIWAGVFAVSSLLIVAATAWRLFGGGAAVAAAALYGLHDLVLDSIDANYVTWAQTPMVAAAGLALLAPTVPRGRKRMLVWCAAGVAAGLAGLCKRPAGIIAVFVIVMAWLDGGRACAGRSDRGEGPGRPIDRARAVGVTIAGITAAHLPIAALYLAAGQLGALWDGYVVSQWGQAYVGQGGQIGGTAALREGVLATAYFVALPLCLATYCAASAVGRQARRDSARLALWAGLTIAAAWVGWRFYKGYFLAAAPPLCILAAAPWGVLGRVELTGAVPAWRRYAVRLVLLLPVVLLVARQAMFIDQLRRDRMRPHDQGGRTIATHISASLQPGDRIWVWGWHLWDVYALTGHRSASRVYKSIGLLTPPNDDTWRNPPTKGSFVDGPGAAALMEDLSRDPPAWIVLGSTVPVRHFDALRTLLRAQYRRDRTVRLGRVQFWQRRDRAPTKRPR